jgi:peptide/nickel transport system substrate-binding protein
MYSSASLPPRGANRGHYINPRVDQLLAQAAAEAGPTAEVQARRRAEYIEVQKILAAELPSIPLWYPENEVVHATRIDGIQAQGEGNYDYLPNAVLRSTPSPP